MQQSPTISCPLKTTIDVDWVGPLKAYIARTYGEPDKYSEECATLNRLRQDLRGAGKDPGPGRDILYRYYGQLELLDLRFPVEERGVRVGFTWYDAFTHKSTSQYSLAFEKASIIFNISAVHSVHAANQNRSEEVGIKTSFHSFQAAAGMFTYINENFLHAPSTDLSRETIKTLISIMLAQAQEVFLEKQIADGKKCGMLAKLAAQAGLLYSQASEGVQENQARGVFDKSWTTLVLAKQNFMESLSQYLQALADIDAGNYGLAIARLQLAEALGKEAQRHSLIFPANPPEKANLSAETGPALIQITKRHAGVVHEKLSELVKDNDFIYHAVVPSESAIPIIQKMPAAKAIPVQDLYQSTEIQRIIGPDIFQKIVPMSVTETASLYDEEKAKLIRAESEKCDLANAEMVAALDYLKLPGSLKLLKNGFENEIDVADEFREWCADMANKPEKLPDRFQSLKQHKKRIVAVLDSTSKSLDHEESVCEKMRAKYQDEWTQQPSSRLTQTLRADIRSYREAIEAAVSSDNQLWTQFRGSEKEISEMTRAGETEDEGGVDALWNSKAGKPNGFGEARNGGETLLDVDDGEGMPSVMNQIERVEELLKKLNLIRRERAQVLKDLKDKVHNDDISNMLILNKKATAHQEQQIFSSELEKFHPHQVRLQQATHKQSALMKELSQAYGTLLQDKRVRAEQAKYEAVSRQRNAVLSKFRKTYQAFLDVYAGLDKAHTFYSEMMETVDSLEKNVETFVSNRRSEGASLLSAIESSKGTDAEVQQQKLREMMQRVSIGSGSNTPTGTEKRPSVSGVSPTAPIHATSPPTTPRYPQYGNFPAASTPPPVPPPPQQYTYPPAPSYQNPTNGYPRRDSYGHNAPPPPPPPRRESFNQPLQSPPPPTSNSQYQPSHYSSPPGFFQQQQQQQMPVQYDPSTYVPPPPPPGPPPGQNRGSQGYGLGLNKGGMQQQQQQGERDPWAGLAGWK